MNSKRLSVIIMYFGIYIIVFVSSLFIGDFLSQSGGRARIVETFELMPFISLIISLPILYLSKNLAKTKLLLLDFIISIIILEIIIIYIIYGFVGSFDLSNEFIGINIVFVLPLTISFCIIKIIDLFKNKKIAKS